ncbi:MAG TPA: hypothetical protein VFP61_06410 [Acidimicrobiales bacterium]|nr:hypothetical protein [Acidimicrobiales bacterium]
MSGAESGPPTGATVDPRLATLIELWDRLDEDQDQPNTLGMTLLVHGHLYSGLLIPARVWAQQMGRMLQAAPGASPSISALSGFYDQMEQSWEQAGTNDDGRLYLHLANVTIGLAADGFKTSLLVRVQAAAVSGWSVGTMGELPNFTRLPAPPAGG